MCYEGEFPVPQASSQGSLTGSTNSSDNMVAMVGPMRDQPPAMRRKVASASPTRAREEVVGSGEVRRRIRVSTSDNAILERDGSRVRDLSEINK